MAPDGKLSRRKMLSLASAAGVAGIAGCTGGSEGKGNDGNSGGSGGGSEGGPAGTAGPWSIDINSPKPVQERINGSEWIPPEYDESEVADEFSKFNLGSMKNDPATKWFHENFKEQTGIEVSPTTVPSKNAVSKMTTLLSSGSPEPAGLQLSQEFFMDFVEKGWLEPVDEIWSDDAYETFPPYYQDQVKTSLDSSLDGEHSYISTAISEGHAMNYSPNLLKELGFPADFYDNPTWEEVREVSEEAQAQNKDYFGYVWYGKGNRYPVYPWLVQTWSYGGDLVQDDGTVVFNTDAGMKALEWQRSMIDDGLVPDVMQYGEGGPQDLYLGERLIGFVGGTDMLPMALDKWGEDTDKYAMGLPPQGKNGRPVSYMNTDFVCINRAAPEAKKRALMVYMDGARSAVASAQEYKKEGNYPSNSAAWDHELLADAKYKDVAKKITENARVELWPKQIQTYDALVTQLQKCWLGQKSPKAALDEAQAEVDSILDQN